MRERFLQAADLARFAVLAASSLGLVLQLDPSAADPLAPKAFWLASGAGLFVGLSAARLWWGARFWIPTGPLRWAFLALPLSALLSFNASPLRAGSEAAFNAWMLACLLVPCVYDFCQEEGNRRRLLYLLLACLAVAALRGLVQFLRIDLGEADRLARAQFRWRLSASFGNPNFYAGFLVLLLPLALWLALEVKPGFLALAFLAGLMAVATGSKAGLLALAFLYFAFGHIGWHSDAPRGQRLKFLRIWALAGVACVLASAALMRQVFVFRYADPTSYKQSAAFRLVTWEGSLKAFKAAPALGHGPGSFSAVYPHFRVPEAMAAQTERAYEVTHPENWILQLMVEQGILGLLAFLAFAWLLLRPLWKKAGLFSSEGRLAAACFLGLSSSLACNLASLDLFLPSTFWFAALLLAPALRLAAPASSGLRLGAGGFMAAMVSVLILLLSLSPGLQARLRWDASRLLQQAKAASTNRQFAEGERLYGMALERDPGNVEARYFEGVNLLEMGKHEAALKSFEKLQTLAPDFVLVHDKKAHALHALGRMNEAQKAWERQLELDPWHLDAARRLSTLYAGTGKLKDAERVLENAVRNFPDNQDFRRNLERVRRSLRG